MAQCDAAYHLRGDLDQCGGLAAAWVSYENAAGVGGQILGCRAHAAKLAAQLAAQTDMVRVSVETELPSQALVEHIPLVVRVEVNEGWRRDGDRIEKIEADRHGGRSSQEFTPAGVVERLLDLLRDVTRSDDVVAWEVTDVRLHHADT